MNTHPIMVKLPKRLYARVERRARQAERSVESEVLAAVTQAMENDEELPAEFAALLEELSLLDDQALWRAARKKIKAGESAQLERLQLKRQKSGLTKSESQKLASLIRQYERHMLVRAQSAALLKQRGHDVSKLLTAR